MDNLSLRTSGPASNNSSSQQNPPAENSGPLTTSPRAWAIENPLAGFAWATLMAVAGSAVLSNAAELRTRGPLANQVELSCTGEQLGIATTAARPGRLKEPHQPTGYQEAWMPTSPGEASGRKPITDRTPVVGGITVNVSTQAGAAQVVTSPIVTAPTVTSPATAPSADATPAAPSAADLTPELIALREKLKQVLLMYYPRHQNTRDNTPWEVMHAIIAYGVDTQLFKGGPDGEKVNAIGWMCFNNPMGGHQMLFVNNQNKLDARRGVGVQGHAGQFLAILAQSHLKNDYPMRVQSRDFTLADLIEHEKEGCVAGEELTFKLISLAHYLDSDASWTTRDGQEWSIERLLLEELKQPIRGAACGGTHRLMGISYAVKKRIQRNKPITGEFVKAQQFIQGYHRYTFSLQNPDGSFSTEWFTRRGDINDIDRKLKTSGHILEWIAYSLSDQELRDPRMIKAVNFVASILLQNDRHTWEIGPLGHGLHGLAIYSTRMFKDSPIVPPPTIVHDASSTNLEARRPLFVPE
jgi:hypothetical protein